MQPLHWNEARWFWQWDALELARGTGISLIISGAAFSFFIPLPASLAIAAVGIALAAAAYTLDAENGPPCCRRLVCRRCGLRTTVGRAQKAGWKCSKCRTMSRFDNLP